MCYLGLHFVTAKMKGALEKKKKDEKAHFLPDFTKAEPHPVVHVNISAVHSSSEQWG